MRCSLPIFQLYVRYIACFLKENILKAKMNTDLYLAVRKKIELTSGAETD